MLYDEDKSNNANMNDSFLLCESKCSLISSFITIIRSHLTQPTFCFGVGEAVSCESKEAGLEILNTKLLPSLGSLDHDAEKGKW